MTFASDGAGFAPRRPNLLARLDDQMLRNIGVSHAQIDAAIRRLGRGHDLLPLD